MLEKEGTKIDFVKWFSELNKDSGKVAGGKGANLGEIYNAGLPVPPGFVVTAQAYDYFIEKAKIKEKIKEMLSDMDYEDTDKLQEVTQKIREMIKNSPMPKNMEDEIIESYEALDIDQFSNSNSYESKTALDILRRSAEPVFVAVRSSATTEDLAEASFAGQQDSFLNVKGNADLIRHVKLCFASLFNARATYYRNKQGFKDAKSSLAVVVQKMVDSDKSGVMFSKDPTFQNDDVIIEAVFGLGEGIVSGQITPDRYIVSRELEIKDKKISSKKIAITRDSGGGKTTIKLNPEKSQSQVLKEFEIKKLAEFGLKLEEHYQKPQDIEFAIEGEGIYIVQTRPITTLEKRTDKEKQITVKGEPILEGMGASPGIAVGKIKIVNDLKDLAKIQKGDIFVTEMTNPDMVVAMQRAAAIVTDEGGMTAHAAIVSRELGIPSIVGTQTATQFLKEGEIITVDGYTGKIYKGKVAEAETKEVKPIKAQTQTKIKIMVDLPSAAERAAKSGAKSVGLMRLEGIIAESGKHPILFQSENRIEEYEEIIFKGVEGIAKYFEEVWIRTSDIRTDEFSNLEGAPKEKEANPMLGFHGVRFSLKNLDILKAELKALKRVSENGKKIGVLTPQVISVEEIKELKKIIKEIGFFNCKVGVMIETPAAVQIAKDLCEEGLDFISFGTNDLTQYTLAIDRGNEKVQYLYDEMHPAVLNQLGYVIRTCKRNNVETSICGQAGSQKPMVKFLVENKIDSISVNPDVAEEIAEYISAIERGENPEEAEKEIENEKSNESKETTKEEVEKKIEEMDYEKISKISQNLQVSFEKPIQEISKKQIISKFLYENTLKKISEEIEKIENSQESIITEIKENIKEGLENLNELTEEDETVQGDFYPEANLPELEETETISELIEEEKYNDKEKEELKKKESGLDIY